MNYIGMPFGMWVLYKKSFRDCLVSELGFSAEEANRIRAAAKPRYRETIEGLPEFEQGDRFKMNIVNCALLAAFLLSMDERPSVDAVTTYYERAMMTKPVRFFFRLKGREKFSERDLEGMRATAKLNAADRNPYSWNMELLPYADNSGYEARFSKCGICALMRELGLFDYVPAMCHLDYAMTEASGTSEFVRSYTLASGGPYCDCGYKKTGWVVIE